MMVALLLYSYAIGERSARKIERRCAEDVAFRVICANRVSGSRHDRAQGANPLLRGFTRQPQIAGLLGSG
jgi:hypothetical protein